jgi:signal transduction histidine kinase
MRSLVARLNAGLALSLAVLFGLIGGLFSLSARALIDQYALSRLEHDTESLLAALNLPAGRPVLDKARTNPVFQRPLSGHYYRILVGAASGESASLTSRSLWDRDIETPRVPVGGREVRHLLGPASQELLVLTSGFRKQGFPVEIAVAEDLSGLYRELSLLRRRYLILFAAVVLSVLAVQTGIVRLTLRPLRRAAEAVSRLERGEIRRLPEDVPSELRTLVEEANRLLDLLGTRLQRSRNAIGNLAHSLKTPLTLLRRLADHPGMVGQPALRGQVLASLESLELLVERELGRARLAGGTAPGQRTHLAREVSQLLAALRSIYRGKGLDIQSDIPPDALFPGDREDLLELLGNLMDNACKWARRQVRVRAEVDSSLAILVEDDGPGCPEHMLSELTARGARLDESVAGHGLGLSIVRDVVDSYAGRLDLGRSPSLGGFLARVSLPLPR